MIVFGTWRPKVPWRRILAVPRTRPPGLTSAGARGRRLLVGLPVVAALAAGLTATALAANWDGPLDGDHGFPVYGGNPVSFTQCDLTYTVHEMFHSNNDHDIKPTDITPDGTHSCSTIDVGVGDNFFGSAPPGFAECHDLISSSGSCNIAHAHMNLSDSRVPEDVFFTLSVVCHEVGHTVGLRHRVSSVASCMWGAGEGHLDSHDRNVLNDHY
jgi:hypothetical protein